MSKTMEGPIWVIGAGSISIPMITALATSTASDIAIIARRPAAAAMKLEGIRRSGKLGDVAIPPSRFSAFSSLRDAPKKTPGLLLVGTKAHQIKSVISELAVHPHVIGPETKILLIQNGWDTENTFASLATKDQIFNARVSTGAEMISLTHSRVSCHVTPVAIGSLAGVGLGPAEDIAASLSDGGFPAHAVPDIAKHLLAKLLCNVPVNALGALYGMSIGELAADGRTRTMMDVLIEESWCAIRQTGASLNWTEMNDFRRYFYGNFVPAASQHRASMEHDYRAGKQTEIDYINGAIVRIARQNGWVAGLNKLVCDLINDGTRLAMAA